MKGTIAKDNATIALSEYIKKKGITMTSISKNTNISVSKLQRSLSENKRALRTDEFLEICNYIEQNPMKFYCKIKK